MHIGNENFLGDRPSIVDLFCGVGGLSLGFKQAGYGIAYALDNNERAVSLYNKNVENVAEVKDAREVDGSEIPDADGIVGGPPCQGFSLAGTRDPKDERSSLVFLFSEMVRRKKPKFFVMENVKGIRSMKAREELKKEFEEIGFDTLELLLQIHEFGAPQLRERAFFVGTRKDLKRDVEQLEAMLRDFKRKGKSVKDVLEDFDCDYFYRHPYTYDRRAVYSIEEPYPTVRTVHRPMPDTYKFHKDDATTNRKEVRPLTEGELAIIQTFPRDFVWEGTKSELRELIGNAVPPLIGDVIGKAIKKIPPKTELTDFF